MALLIILVEEKKSCLGGIFISFESCTLVWMPNLKFKSYADSNLQQKKALSQIRHSCSKEVFNLWFACCWGQRFYCSVEIVFHLRAG